MLWPEELGGANGTFHPWCGWLDGWCGMASIWAKMVPPFNFHPHAHGIVWTIKKFHPKGFVVTTPLAL